MANLGRESEHLDVQFHLDTLGLNGQSLTATDTMTQQPVSMEDGRIKMELPSLGWTVIWMKRQP